MAFMRLIGPLVHRLPEDWQQALRDWGKRAASFLRRVKRRHLILVRLLIHTSPIKEKTLYAFYDLGREPITFDFLFFLVAADLKRRAKGLDAIQVVFVPGEKGGFREEWPDYERVVDRESRRWRVSNLLLPTLQFLPSRPGHIFCHSRGEADVMASLAKHVYPRNYDAGSPETQGYAVTAHREVRAAGRAGKRVRVLTGNEQARRYVDQWLAPRAGGRKVVSVTLREYGYYPARNSNVTAWTAFARGLDPEEYLVVFVRDLERAMESATGTFTDLAVFESAPLNLELRMALYERSYLNLGSSNGPLILCVLNEITPYLIFKMITPGVPQATVEWLTNLGIDIGAERHPFASPFQKLVWEDDDLDVIRREFKTMCEALEMRRRGHSYGEAMEGPPETVSERSG